MHVLEIRQRLGQAGAMAATLRVKAGSEAVSTDEETSEPIVPHYWGPNTSRIESTELYFLRRSLVSELCLARASLRRC